MANYKYFLIYKKNQVGGLDIANLVKTKQHDYTTRIVETVGKNYITSEISVGLYNKIKKLQQSSPNADGYMIRVMELYTGDPEIQKLIIGLDSNEVKRVEDSPSE